jgi:hypothetical protein
MSPARTAAHVRKAQTLILATTRRPSSVCDYRGQRLLCEGMGSRLIGVMAAVGIEMFAAGCGSASPTTTPIVGPSPALVAAKISDQLPQAFASAGNGFVSAGITGEQISVHDLTCSATAPPSGTDYHLYTNGYACTGSVRSDSVGGASAWWNLVIDASANDAGAVDWKVTTASPEG